MKVSLRPILFTLLLLTSYTFIFSQGFYFGVKGGPTGGTQNWGGFDRDILFSGHVAGFIETYREDSNASFVTSLGYHARGSAERAFGSGLRANQTFRFNNAVFSLGMKNRFSSYNTNRAYYTLGLRLEYTLSTNLEQYLVYNGYFPVDPFVNKFNYGLYGGVGLERRFSEFVSAFVEATLSPDISNQYEQLAGGSVRNPFTGQTTALRSQKIRNTTLEITLGIKFLRKVIYVN